MTQIDPMPLEQVLPFLFVPEEQRDPRHVAAWREALRQADIEQSRPGSGSEMDRAESFE
jgi:hypothetical protein